MKNKIKNYIYIFSIFYMIIISFLIVINLFSINTKIHLSSLEEFNKTLNKYEKEVSSLSSSSCKDFINDLIKYVRSNNYEGEVDIIDLYNKGNNILQYYTKGKNACNLSDEVLKDNYLVIDYLSSIIPYESIYNSNMFNYEISLKELFTKESKPDYLNLYTEVKRNNELSIISKYIKLAKEVPNEK